MNLKKNYTVHGEGHTTKFTHLTEDLVFMERDHHWKSPSKQVDVYGDGWMLFLGQFPPGQVRIFGCDVFTFEDGPTALFVPSFSVVEWSLNPGFIHWTAFRSLKKHNDLPSTISYFDWLPPKDLRTSDGFINHIKGIQRISPVALSRKPSGTAHRIKNYLDRNFSKNQSIGDISRVLNVPYSTLALEFKKGYGLSPAVYRNKLRVMDSMRLMGLDERSATTTCYDVGFNDFSNFYRNFRNTMSLKPSAFVSDKSSV